MNHIAHVVLDLPLEGHFDYLIPYELATHIVVGLRVKVSFGSKTMVGFVIGLANEAAVIKVKPIKDIYDAQPVFNEYDLIFARSFAAYYACSLGEALTVMTRHRRKALLPMLQSGAGTITIEHCPDGAYWPTIEKVIQDKANVHILVPDACVARSLGIPIELRSCVGLRSSMFEAFVQNRLIIAIDDDNASYKQEQSPMYDARDVLLMASRVYGFDLYFISACPSVELMYLAAENKAQYHLSVSKLVPKPTVIDLSNYKFLDKGMLSPPVRNRLQENINAKRQSILLLNRRGSFSVTRCTECGHILKCQRCEASITYLRSRREFVCRLCSFHIPEAGACPSCHKNNWKSFGMGVEQLQKELSSLFPTARIIYFEKESQELPESFDVLIATQAIFRFKGKMNVQTIVLVDIDSELNRMDMRSSFKGWSQAVHARQLAAQMLVQTRNPQHHVLKALKSDDDNLFYKQELQLRKELDFAPFYHWAHIVCRSRVEKNAHRVAMDMYNKLEEQKCKEFSFTVPIADMPSKLRDQYRFKFMAGGHDVETLVQNIKNALGEVKHAGTLVTLNIDP